MRATGFALKTWTSEGYVDVVSPEVRTYRGFVQGNPNMRVNATVNTDGTISANLSDDDIEDIASWYAGQKGLTEIKDK